MKKILLFLILPCPFLYFTQPLYAQVTDSSFTEDIFIQSGNTKAGCRNLSGDCRLGEWAKAAIGERNKNVNVKT